MSNGWELEVRRKAEVETCPPGLHLGVVIALLNVGTHDENDSRSGRSFESKKAIIAFELPEVRKRDGWPFIFAEAVACSVNVGSKLHAYYTALCAQLAEGARPNVAELLGKPCQLTVIHEHKPAKGEGGMRTYAKLANVSALYPGVGAPRPTRQPLIWSVLDGTPIPDVSWLPKIYKDFPIDLIKSSREFQEGKVPPGSAQVPQQAPPQQPQQVPHQPQQVAYWQQAMGQPQAPQQYQPVPPPPPPLPPAPPQHQSPPPQQPGYAQQAPPAGYQFGANPPPGANPNAPF